MCNRLSEVLASARATVASLDVGGLTAAEASAAFEVGAELEKLGASVKVLVAPRIAQSDAWAGAGYRSPEEWMARAAGTSIGAAKATVETGRKLETLPATAAAVKRGSLSLPQVVAVAEAAAADRSAEAKLLETAAGESLNILRDRARRVVLDSRGSVEERYERQRGLRSFRTWTDDEGMTAGSFRLTPEVGAAVVNRIKAEADRFYRRAHREGRQESSENYAADALVALVNGEAKSSSRGSEVVVHVSYEALRRGFVEAGSGELCEVPGFGAVPVSRARDMLADSFLKGVVVRGTQVTHVKHFGRHRPAEIDTALTTRTFLEQGSVRCDVSGCGRSDGIEWDHVVDFAKGGPTSEGNLRPLCRFHHREKTAGRLRRERGGWVRAPAPAPDRNPP